MKPHVALLRALRAADGRLVNQAEVAQHLGLSRNRVHAAATFLTELELVGRRGNALCAIGPRRGTLEDWIEASFVDVEWARRALVTA